MPDQRIPQAVPRLQEFSPEWKVTLASARLKPIYQPFRYKEYPHSRSRSVLSHTGRHKKDSKKQILSDCSIEYAHSFRPVASGHKKRSRSVVAAGPLQDGDYLLSHLRSTIGVTKLNFSVRNGKRWNLRAIVTWISFYVFMTHKQAIPALVSKLKVYIIHPFSRKVNGQLVMLGFGVSTFTPASYQRHRLWRPWEI